MRYKYLLIFAPILCSFMYNESANAQSLLAGEYSCSVVGSKTISDGRGSSITYRSGKLIVNNEGGVTFKSKAVFNILGRKPRVETLPLNGSGELDSVILAGSIESASASFKVKPAKKVSYKRINLLGNANFDLEAEDLNTDGDTPPDFGDLAVVKTASGSIKSKIGSVRFACE